MEDALDGRCRGEMLAHGWLGRGTPIRLGPNRKGLVRYWLVDGWHVIMDPPPQLSGHQHANSQLQRAVRTDQEDSLADSVGDDVGEFVAVWVLRRCLVAGRAHCKNTTCPDWAGLTDSYLSKRQVAGT